MSSESSDPRLDQSKASDESLLAAHERLLETQPDERAHYKLLPIGLLFLFSGLILFAGTYLNRYQGNYDATVFNENTKPVKGEVAVAAIDPVALGKHQFESACITCHQATGQGLPGTYPPLAGSEWVNGPEDRVIRIVLYGLSGPVHVTNKEFSAAAMPSFGKVSNSGYNWSDEKIAAVLTYVRQEWWGNKSAAITAEKVAQIHSAVGNDHPAWSEADLQAIK